MDFTTIAALVEKAKEQKARCARMADEFDAIGETASADFCRTQAGAYETTITFLGDVLAGDI